MSAIIMREIGDRAAIRDIARRITESMEGVYDMNTTLELVTAAYEFEAQYLRELGAGDGCQAPYDEDEAFDYIIDGLMAGQYDMKSDELARIVDDYIEYENQYLESEGRLTWCSLAEGA